MRRSFRSLSAMTTTARAKQRKAASAAPRLSRLHAPPGMAPAAWQAALRRQFGRVQDFSLENLGPEPVFSEFPRRRLFARGRRRARGTYRVFDSDLGLFTPTAEA